MNMFSDNKFTIEIKDNILYLIWHKESYTAEEVDFGITKRLEITGNNSYLTIADFRKVKFSNKAARDRLANKDAEKGIKALAIIVSNDVNKILVNLYMQLYKPVILTKAFSTKKSAINWLNILNSKQQ